MQTRLIAFSVAALDAEERSPEALCAHLKVAQPVDWPPPFNEDAVRNWFRDQLRADPSLAPWLGHYVVCTMDGRDTLVGTAGYKGPPDASGMVEIGYSHRSRLSPDGDWHSDGSGAGTAGICR